MILLFEYGWCGCIVYGLLVVELSLTTGGKQLVFCTGLATANQQPGLGQVTNQRASDDQSEGILPQVIGITSLVTQAHAEKMKALLTRI